MNWFEQSKSMMDAWADAQQQMMNNWMSMGQSPLPGMEAFTAMSDMWQQMALQGIRAWTSDADPTIQDVSEKMFASQNAMMQFMKLTAQIWGSVVPTLQSGGDWQAELSTQMEQVRNQLLQASTEGPAITRNMNQLWRTYLDQWQTFFGPWVGVAQSGFDRMGDLTAGDHSALLDMTNLYWDAFQDTFGKLLQAPSLGYTREMDEKLRRGFAAWLDFQQASLEYQVILAEVWSEAFEQLMQELLAAVERGEKVEGLRDFLNRWSNTADRVFKDAFSSELYVTVQGKLVNTMMAYRKRQRDVTEMFLDVADLPTRSEIDEAHRRIYELRKEVKALKKEIATIKKPSASRGTKKKTTTRKKKKTAKADTDGAK